MMIVDPQRQQAITEKIVKTVRSSKKFITVVYPGTSNNIKVDVELDYPADSDYIFVVEAIKFSLEKWGNSSGWTENLYATLAYKWNNKDIVIYETDNAGNGTTTHFYGSRSSQAI